MPNIENKVETKAERFKRLAERRATEVLVKLRLLGNLSDKKNYEYSDGQIRQLFEALETELRSCKSRYKSSDVNSSSRFVFKKTL